MAPRIKAVYSSSAENNEKMKKWGAEFGQCVPQKAVRNLSTKDNPGTLPVNLYENPGVPLKLLDMNSFEANY